VSLDGITGSGNPTALRNAEAVPQAGGVLPSLAARQRYDPLAPFQIPGRSQPSRRSTDPQSDGADTPSSGGQASGGGGSAPGRPVTAFVAQFLAQDHGQTASSSPPVSQIAAGLRAYARSSGAAAAQGNATVEIIPPRLSSGHALDLAV